MSASGPRGVAVGWALALAACRSGGDAGAVATELLLLEELAPPVVTRWDLGAASAETVFAAPSLGFVYELEVDGSELLMAYTPPPGADEGEPYDRSTIVGVEESGDPYAVACEDAAGVWCSYPVAGADAVWFVESPASGGSSLRRRDRASGVTESVRAWATEPAVSPDSDRVAWIAVDPTTGQRTLEIGDADGLNAQTVVAAGAHDDIGLPFFSADGRSVFYLALEEPVSSWAELLLGALLPTAHAHANHDRPGDWWRVPVDGGPAVQITHLHTLHYDGRADPGGEWIFIATREGVLQAQVDTGELRVVAQGRAYRAVAIVGR